MSEPNLAEVAEKAVDHIANGVQQIADAVNKIAPGAWEVAVRKHRTEGYVDIVLGCIFILLTIVACAVAVRAARQVENEEDRTGFTILSLVLGATLTCLFAFLLAKPGILEASAPEYFAAMDILAAVHR